MKLFAAPNQKLIYKAPSTIDSKMQLEIQLVQLKMGDSCILLVNWESYLGEVFSGEK